MSSYERNLHTTQELPKTIELWHGSRTTETVNVKRECGEREDTGEARIHSQVDHQHVPERELSKDHGKDFRLQDSLNSKTHLFESDQECSPCPCPHNERYTCREKATQGVATEVPDDHGLTLSPQERLDVHRRVDLTELRVAPSNSRIVKWFTVRSACSASLCRLVSSQTPIQAHSVRRTSLPWMDGEWRTCQNDYRKIHSSLEVGLRCTSGVCMH